MAAAGSSRRERLALGAVLAVALAVRLVYALALAPRPYPDTDAYQRIALNLLQHGQFSSESPPTAVGGSDAKSPPTAVGGNSDGRLHFPPLRPTAYRPCLYPLFLAGLYALTGPSDVAVGVAQALLGTAAVWLTWRAGRALFGAPGGLLPAAVTAVNPLLIQSAGLLMTEALFTLLFAALVLLVGRMGGRPTWRWGVGLGAVGGLGALCRPTMLTVLVVLVPVLILTGRTRMRARLAFAAAAAGVGALSLLPWAVRNWRQFGWPILTTTHGGYTFLLGNNERFYHWTVEEGRLWPEDDLRAWQDGLARSTAGMTEVERDNSYYAQARTFIRRSLRRFVHLTAVKSGWFWRLWPHEMYSRPVRAAVGVFYGVEFLLAAAGLVRVRRRPEVLWPFLALILTLTAVHAVYWSNIRFRAPLEPLLALLASASLSLPQRG